MTVIEEDTDGLYSHVLLRCLLSQGVYDNHKCLVVSESKDLSDVKCLPTKTTVSQDVLPGDQQGPGNNKIAWRYASKQVDNSLLQGQSTERLDLSTNFTEEHLKQNDLSSRIEGIKVEDLSDVAKTIGADRIVIETLNSPSHGLNDVQLFRLVYQLKSLTRNSISSTVMITVNPGYFSNCTRTRLHSLADGVFQLETFNSVMSPYPDFEGLFLLHKIPRLNSLNVARKIETLDLGFQLKKNKRFFEVDKLFLPPEGDAPSRSTAPSCSSLTSRIDF